MNKNYLIAINLATLMMNDVTLEASPQELAELHEV